MAFWIPGIKFTRSITGIGLEIESGVLANKSRTTQGLLLIRSKKKIASSSCCPEEEALKLRL